MTVPRFLIALVPRPTAQRATAKALNLRARFWKAPAILGLMVFAALLGASIPFLPWFLYFGAAALVLYPLLVFKAPWAAFTLYAIGTFVAPGFKSADALTLFTLILFALRWLHVGRPAVLPAFLAKPYIVLLAAVAVALLVGGAKRHSVPMIYMDGRGFLYWLWLPLLYSLAQSTSDGVKRCARAFALIAAVIAFVALVQYVTGVQVVAAGRVGDLDAANAGQTRVQLHGFLFIAVATVWALVAAVHSPRRIPWLVPFLLLMLAALYANFGRALWFWTAVAVVFSVYLSGRQRGGALAAILVVGGVFAAGGLLLAKPKVVDNIVDRVVSVREEGGARTSYGWRKLENQDALPHIMRNPVTGLGLGAEYRRWMHEVATFEQHTRYVHNSYFFIALKAGVPCLVAMLVLLLRAWRRGWYGFRRLDVPQRAARIAALASLFPLLGLSITQPELVTPMSVLLFVLMTVLLGSCDRPGKSSARPAAVPQPIN
jgi:O-antigen ligase